MLVGLSATIMTFALIMQITTSFSFHSAVSHS
jgi:hypothetical protein